MRHVALMRLGFLREISGPENTSDMMTHWWDWAYQKALGQLVANLADSLLE
jgi:hypothetical protein